MKLNTAAHAVAVAPRTHEGAPAASITALQELERTVSACLLWENGFYESGTTVADRISALIPKCGAYEVANLAGKARSVLNLRHVPLYIAAEMCKHETHKHLVPHVLESVIQRPDEITEFLAIYSRDRTGRKKLNKIAKVVQRGLAAAFRKFDEYRLAKWDTRDGEIKLRDALFICHAKPKNKEQGKLWKRLIDGKLTTPDTWEVALSGGADKKATFTRLIKEKQLGGLALLRNLRNMQEAGVDMAVIRGALGSMKTERVLPFRFVAAARYAPSLEPDLEAAMFRSLEGAAKMPGQTGLLIDVSGSMDEKISEKSDMTRLDAACALAILCREICEHVDVLTFSNGLVQVPSRRGFALRDAIRGSQPHQSTHLGEALKLISGHCHRLIVFTDEQSHDKVPGPHGVADVGYMVNVASNQRGVGYGPWRHIDGFSESIIRYIQHIEGAE